MIPVSSLHFPFSWFIRHCLHDGRRSLTTVLLPLFALGEENPNYCLSATNSLFCFTALNSHWNFEVNITKGQHWSSHFLPSCPPPACLYSVHYFTESHSLKEHYIDLLLLLNICENSQYTWQKPLTDMVLSSQKECFPCTPILALLLLRGEKHVTHYLLPIHT